MNANVMSGRSEAPGQLIILDAEYSIISAQCGDAGGGLIALSASRLPTPLEEFVRAATSTWTRFVRPPSRTVLNEHFAVRVFPLVGEGGLFIGVFIERYRVRAADPARKL